jgi:hypothetical protein
MATYTDQQMLDSVRSAIVTVAEAGQSYRLASGAQVTRADLAMLHTMEQIYQDRVDAASNGMTVSLARLGKTS